MANFAACAFTDGESVAHNTSRYPCKFPVENVSALWTIRPVAAQSAIVSVNVGLITVTRVEVTSDLDMAKVFISVLGGGDDAPEPKQTA